MTRTRDEHKPYIIAPGEDLDLYRLSVNKEHVFPLFRTLFDQIRPEDNKVRAVGAGSGQSEADAVLTSEEVVFLKLIYPELKADWICPWDKKNADIAQAAR